MLQLPQEKDPIVNRLRRKKTEVEERLWEYIRDYSITWVFKDNPRSWSANISRCLKFGDGWLASLRNRSTSCAVSSIVDVCRALNEHREPSAPQITPATAFLAAERKMGDPHVGLLCISLSLAHQIELARAARKEGKSLDEFVSEMLLNYATTRMLGD